MKNTPHKTGILTSLMGSGSPAPKGDAHCRSNRSGARIDPVVSAMPKKPARATGTDPHVITPKGARNTPQPKADPEVTSKVDVADVEPAKIDVAMDEKNLFLDAEVEAPVEVEAPIRAVVEEPVKVVETAEAQPEPCGAKHNNHKEIKSKPGSPLRLEQREDSEPSGFFLDNALSMAGKRKAPWDN